MVEREERLLNLVIALHETRRPLSRAEIVERIAGYSGVNDEASRRTFERDKSELRALGVPITVAPLERMSDEQGYTIAPEDYALPSVQLEPSELTALALAVDVTGLTDTAAASLRRLGVDAELADPAMDADPLGATTSVGIDLDLTAPFRDELAEAVTARSVVRFGYGRPGAEVTQRTLEPHGLVHRAGHWYVVGHDRDRGERRAFRLDRIRGAAAGPALTVLEGPGAYPAPPPVTLSDVVPESQASEREAQVWSSESAAWEVARRARGRGTEGDAQDVDGRLFTVPVGDTDAFLDWIGQLGDGVAVREPAALREAVAARAHAVIAAVDAGRRADPETTGPPLAEVEAEPPHRRRVSSTLARVARMLTYVPWLLAHPGADVDEVCQRFDISRAALERDIDLLGFCGLPGYGGGDLIEASIDADQVTVRLADAFRRPLRPSLREALALYFASRALESVPGLGVSEELVSARDKLQAILGVEPAIAVDVRAPGDEHLPDLQVAVAEQRVVKIVHRSGSALSETRRAVEPWQLVGTGGAWYLQGWCRLATAPRDFRLDRIVHLEVTDEQGRPPPQEGVGAPRYTPGPGDEQVVLDLDRDVGWLVERLAVDAVEDLGTQGLRVRLRTPALEWLARLVLGRAGTVRPVAPAALGDRVEALARTQLARHLEPTGDLS